MKKLWNITTRTIRNTLQTLWEFTVVALVTFAMLCYIALRWRDVK